MESESMSGSNASRELKQSLGKVLLAGTALAGAVAAMVVVSNLAFNAHGQKGAQVSGAVAHAEPQPDPAERRAFFGDLHLHTGYSFDAYSFMGTRSTPDEAYRFAKGETVTYLGQ
jgi:hypothetical protein